MRFHYALSMAMAGSAWAQGIPPLPTTSLSPAAASSAAASIASRVVSEINAAATAAVGASNIAKTLNPNNALSVGPQIAGDFSAIITDLSDATTALAGVGIATASSGVHTDFNPSACLQAADPQTCVNEAVSKLALPQPATQKRDSYAGSIAARAAQASGSGSVSITFTVNEQAAIANAYKNYAALQSALAATLAQERANIGAYLIPIRNSVIVLQGTADALALAIQNDVTTQYDNIVSQARAGLDTSLQVTIRAYAS